MQNIDFQFSAASLGGKRTKKTGGTLDFGEKRGENLLKWTFRGQPETRQRGGGTTPKNQIFKAGPKGKGAHSSTGKKQQIVFINWGGF